MNGVARTVMMRLSGDYKVKSFTELYEILDDHQPHQFCILLDPEYGIVSRRTIRLMKNGMMKVTLHFDGSGYRVSKWEMEVGVKDNIGVSIGKGFFSYEP